MDPTPRLESSLPDEPDLSSTGELYQQLSEAITAIQDGLESGTFDATTLGARSPGYRQKLAVLQALIEMPDPLIRPDLDPYAPRGHSFRAIEKGLSLRPGDGLEMLEDLADLGLLQRELFNKVHLCPRCDHCQINFRETCPLCGTIEVEVERMIHHFHCGYMGIESDFARAIELYCPKCRRRLEQLGQDFERPHDTYVCKAGGHLFEEPEVQGQCLRCSAISPGRELRPFSIHRYRPTQLSMRAVELRRLTGLDVSQILYNSSLGLATRDFVTLEIQREILRQKRYGGSFATGLFWFELHGKPYPVLREWPAEMIRELGTVLVASVRELDLVALLNHSTLGVMLYATHDEGAAIVGKRLLAEMNQSLPSTRSGQALKPRWQSTTWHADAQLENVLAFFDQGVEAA